MGRGGDGEYFDKLSNLWGDGEYFDKLSNLWGDGEMGRWGEGEMGRWGDKGKYKLLHSKLVTGNW